MIDDNGFRVCVVCRQTIAAGSEIFRLGYRWRHAGCIPRTTKKMPDNSAATEEEIRQQIRNEIASAESKWFNRGRVHRKPHGEG